MIGSSDGDCAPSSSHTTGRVVFRIRRWNRQPNRRRAEFERSDGTMLRARCSSGWAATPHAPRLLVATPGAFPSTQAAV